MVKFNAGVARIFFCGIFQNVGLISIDSNGVNVVQSGCSITSMVRTMNDIMTIRKTCPISPFNCSFDVVGDWS